MFKTKIPLIIFTWSPQDHDNTEDDGEKKMPECIIHPEISPLCEAVHDLVILDAPEHEDDAGDDAEHEGVGEVFVHRQLHEVPPQPELACGGHQGGEHPPVRIINVMRLLC